MNFNSSSIRTKLIFLLSFTAIVALGISFLASAYYIVQNKRENSLHNLTQIAQITAENMSASLAFFDDTSAKKILQPLKINTNIENALVYTSENVLFASYINKNISETHSNDILESTLESLPQGIEKNVDWNHISVTLPIVLDANILGYIKIVSDTKEIEHGITDSLQRLFIVGSLIVFLIVLVSFSLHKIFTTPIYTLLEIMKEIKINNNYNVKIETDSDDEFKDLYSGFASMITTIDEQNEKIAFIHKQTRDSIDYSANIQRSLLPRDENITEFFQDSFTVWQPKDTVDGY